MIVPLAFTLSIQAVSGIPHPSHLADLGVREGFVVLVSRALFAPGELLVNALHVPVFAVLVILWCWALQSWCRTPRNALLIAALVSLCFAVLNEWSQLYVPRRVPSPGDALANAFGVGLGLVLAALARRPLHSDSRPPENRATGSTGE